MDVLLQLEQIKKIDQLIDAKIAERKRVMELATNISPGPMDGMPHSNTGEVSRKVENAVVKLIALENEIDRLLDLYVDYKQHMIDALEKLPTNEYGVLHRYYIQYMTWENVAEDMGYSVQHVYRLKKKGLRDLERVMLCYYE